MPKSQRAIVLDSIYECWLRYTGANVGHYGQLFGSSFLTDALASCLLETCFSESDIKLFHPSRVALDVALDKRVDWYSECSLPGLISLVDIQNANGFMIYQ